ncbi:MAG: hypothetical protein NTW87_16545, partial [Planctomycetota bacterium]|nr:hypothetical protein [Planctomycetota bacterium]
PDDLRAVFESFGATNETVTKPGREVTVPFSFNYAGLSLTSTVTAVYTATAGGAGKVYYYFGASGYPGSGYLRVFGASAVESGKTARVHAFVVTGNVGPGGKQGLVKADSGAWRITLGNYVEDIPVTSLAENKGVYSFYGAKGKTGLVQLVYNPRNGAFILLWKAVPAEGDSPSGMALAKSTFWRADMALSLDLDVQGGGEFQASGYVRFGRKNYTSKKWKLR